MDARRPHRGRGKNLRAARARIVAADFRAVGLDRRFLLRLGRADVIAMRGLGALEVVVAREGQFDDWLRSKGKLGGQHKIPRLSNNRKTIEEIMAV